MAGASIEVTFDDAAVIRAINQLVDAGKDLTPVMRDIGEHLLNTTRERFKDEQAPDGTPWASLTESTKQRKRRNTGKILTESGDLRGHGLVYQARRDLVEVGSPLIYAGTHQFGAEAGAFGSMSNGAPIPWGDIPPRPFLGVWTDDEAAILRILTEHLESGLK